MTKPLSIILCSEEHEKIQMAAMTAALAAVSERQVSMFVSMGAVFSFCIESPKGRKFSGGTFSELMLEKNAPNALDLLKQGKELGKLSLYLCSMALDITEIDETALIPNLFDEVIGLTKFLADSEDSQLAVF